MNKHAFKSKPPTIADLRTKRDEILRIAASHDAQNVRVFGSIARGDAIASSDVNILVDIVTDVDGFEYFGLVEDLRRDLEVLLGRDVHIVDSSALSSRRDRVLSEAVPL